VREAERQFLLGFVVFLLEVQQRQLLFHRPAVEVFDLEQSHHPGDRQPQAGQGHRLGQEGGDAKLDGPHQERRVHGGGEEDHRNSGIQLPDRFGHGDARQPRHPVVGEHQLGASGPEGFQPLLAVRGQDQFLEHPPQLRRHHQPADSIILHIKGGEFPGERADLIQLGHHGGHSTRNRLRVLRSSSVLSARWVETAPTPRAASLFWLERCTRLFMVSIRSLVRVAM